MTHWERCISVNMSLVYLNGLNIQRQQIDATLQSLNIIRKYTILHNSKILKVGGKYSNKTVDTARLTQMETQTQTQKAVCSLLTRQAYNTEYAFTNVGQVFLLLILFPISGINKAKLKAE